MEKKVRKVKQTGGILAHQEKFFRKLKEILLGEIPEGTFSRDQIVNDFIKKAQEKFIIIEKLPLKGNEDEDS